MRAEGKPGKFSDLLGGTLGKFRMCVQACAHGGSTNSKVVEAVEHLLQALDVAIEQAGPAAEFLSNGERHGVLQVSATDFYDAVEFFRLSFDRVAHRFDGRY